MAAAQRCGGLVPEDAGGPVMGGQRLTEFCQQRLHPRLGLAMEADGRGLVDDERVGARHGAELPPHRSPVFEDRPSPSPPTNRGRVAAVLPLRDDSVIITKSNLLFTNKLEWAQ